MLIREVLGVKSAADIFGVQADATVAEAVAKMVEHGIGSLVVMKDGTLVGFVTERDIVKGMHRVGVCLTDAKVCDLMEQEPLVVTPEDSVDYARDAMTKSHTSHLVVLDGHKLAGVISFHDVARACLKEANFENALLKRYIKHWPE
ncbi:MAG: CBS domain-containing protein [Thiobacillaceae bacterium]|jgi:CBS domain-containing protein|nr:CBS domain-containing protein [Hydrogenophilales bacterium]MBP8901489.1 CBS domain-containing protein [Thiobacillaceae bacterium]MBP9915727.1 CBS domain-containing protein [Thiobacillaceae bacterium]